MGHCRRVPSYDDGLEKTHYRAGAEPAAWVSFSLERTTDGPTAVFSGRFLEIEQSESVTVASDNIQAFRRK